MNMKAIFAGKKNISGHVFTTAHLVFITASNAVHIYWFSYIQSHFHLFITSRVYLEPKLLAQLVEHSIGIVEVLCSNPVQDRTEFFSVLIL